MATSDELIKKNVVDELYWNDSVDASCVKVEVEQGVVFLSGTVSNYRARTASAESAAGIHGVLNVQNRIVVDPNHTAGATPDEVIQDTAVKALCWNPDFQGANITVNVNQGVVVLEGTVGGPLEEKPGRKCRRATDGRAQDRESVGGRADPVPRR